MTGKYSHNYFVRRDYLDTKIACAVKKILIENNLTSVLDVGCGTGKLVKFLNDNGFQAKGCDPNPEALKVAAKFNQKGSIVNANVTKLPFKKASFGLVCCVSVIEHLTKREAKIFLNEAKRVLKPQGFVFIITPNFSTPLRFIQGKNWFGYLDPTHITFYTPKQLGSALHKTGLTVKINPSIKYEDSNPQDLPNTFKYLPGWVNKLLFHMFFASPFSKLRNSFWILAQK